MFYYLIRLIFFYYYSTLIYNCSPRISRHGNIFSDDEIKILKNTKLNKSEIIEILGQPSTKSTFSDNIWYYIFLFKKKKHIFKVRNTSNKILKKLKFDENKLWIDYNIIKNNKSINVKTVKVDNK